jgi:putative tryptophan/tyrosine transport system substrate-binding protein
MTSRRSNALALLLVFMAASVAAEAQQARPTIPRLCFLTFDPGTPQESRFHAFFQGLRDLNYVDGSVQANGRCRWPDGL